MRITREVFAELFGVHLPEWSCCAWMRDVRYEFVDELVEIEELERLLGGVRQAGDKRFLRLPILPL